jgi:adenylate cyclase
MGREIERRFLVSGEGWRAGVSASSRLSQGYLAREGGVTVRVRIAGDAAALTIKGPGGLVLAEVELPDPAHEINLPPWPGGEVT